MHPSSPIDRSQAGRPEFPRAVLFAALAAVLPASFPAAAYTLVDLGMDVSPADINNAGMIVGSRKTDAGSVAVIGSAGKWIFLTGFWGAVFSSMLGVWQGVPYLFADFCSSSRSKSRVAPVEAASERSPQYLFFLIYLSLYLLLLINPENQKV